MQTELDVGRLVRDRLPLSAGYALGCNHTGFEYVRDHLGYRLELQSATFPKRLPLVLQFSAHFFALEMVVFNRTSTARLEGGIRPGGTTNTGTSTARLEGGIRPGGTDTLKVIRLPSKSLRL